MAKIKTLISSTYFPFFVRTLYQSSSQSFYLCPIHDSRHGGKMLQWGVVENSVTAARWRNTAMGMGFEMPHGGVDDETFLLPSS